METPQKEKSNAELCQIRIMFPVSSDEQAIEIKKKIADVLINIPDVQTQFTLMPTPNRP